MDTHPELTALDVAEHWPYIRSHLLLERSPVAGIALEALAFAQVESGGEPVHLGRGQFMAMGMTSGQAGRARTVLLDLESRGVVKHHDGSGQRSHLWTFQPSIIRWRRTPWRYSGRDVDRMIRACACRAARAAVAQFPGQDGALSRGSANYWLPEPMHIRRPGFFPVEARDNCARRATNAQRPGLSPVEARDYGAAAGTPIPLSLVPSEPSLTEGESESIDPAAEELAKRIRGAMAKHGIQVWGSQGRELDELLEENVDRGDELVAMVRGAGWVKTASGMVQMLKSVCAAVDEPVRAHDPHEARRRVLQSTLAGLRKSADLDLDEIAALEHQLATLDA